MRDFRVIPMPCKKSISAPVLPPHRRMSHRVMIQIKRKHAAPPSNAHAFAYWTRIEVYCLQTALGS